MAVLPTECGSCQIQEREHKLQLAGMDSVYLKREVASLEARLQATQEERDSARAAAADAKARHNDLCSNVLLVRPPLTGGPPAGTRWRPPQRVHLRG